jgi:2-polyprenyl-6-methoxyphenol hydroxylase-like FAD-dependent oxidoreductase
MVHDVIIAGAGPVGLLLACELGLAKRSVLVLEQAADPQSPLKQLPFGMRGLWGPSIEAFYRRGLLDELATPLGEGGAGLPKPGGTLSGSQRRGPAGHFAGIQFDYANIDSSRWSFKIPGPGDTLLGCAMEHIERVLTARALSLGVEIRRGYGVTGLAQSEDEVTVRVGEHQYRARYLVGCDGGRSTVRKLAGFEFAGTEPEFTGYSVKVDLKDPEKLKMGRNSSAHGSYTQWQAGAIGMAEFDGGAHHRMNPITLEHVQAVLRRVSGTDVTVTALHLAATWTDRSRQATTYRKGRLLLAGDAAHVHSPLGGQGLNLGLGDALNLGWKLAATLGEDAPEGLLDSYTAERHPIGARILDWTRAQVALMRPNRGSSALAAVMRDLMSTQDGATYFAERIWGVSVRYDLGDEHPVVGRSCPDFELEDGTRVGALLRSGRGLLLDFEGSLASVNGNWGDRVQHVASDVKERLGLRALLVRPDGFVAWASETTPSVEDVARAAERWFTSRQ